MAEFTVALAGLDDQSVPEWALRRLIENGIDLISRECRTKAELIDLAAGADVVWVFGGSTIITADCLPELPRCLALLRTGTGTDNIPVEEASQAGIVVAITPEAGRETVAEHGVALLLAALRQVAAQDRLVHAGTWDRYGAWPRWHLRGQTLGLIGFGAIARAFVRQLSGFDLSVAAFDPFVADDVFEAYGVDRRDFHDVLRSCQIVSLHCPLTDRTHHLVGEQEFRAMRRDAVLINTARGGLVDESALCRALSEGWIAGAGLDVLEVEPPDPRNPLLRLDNVVITPHIAAYSDTFFADSWRLSVETLVDLAHGYWPRVCANPQITPRRPLSRREADGQYRRLAPSGFEREDQNVALDTRAAGAIDLP